MKIKRITLNEYGGSGGGMKSPKPSYDLVKSNLKKHSASVGEGLEGVYLFGSYLDKQINQVNDIDVIFKFNNGYSLNKIKELRRNLKSELIKRIKVNGYGGSGGGGHINTKPLYDIVLINSDKTFEYFLKRNKKRIQRIDIN